MKDDYQSAGYYYWRIIPRILISRPLLSEHYRQNMSFKSLAHITLRHILVLPALAFFHYFSGYIRRTLILCLFWPSFHSSRELPFSSFSFSTGTFVLKTLLILRKADGWWAIFVSISGRPQSIFAPKNLNACRMIWRLNAGCFYAFRRTLAPPARRDYASLPLIDERPRSNSDEKFRWFGTGRAFWCDEENNFDYRRVEMLVSIYTFLDSRAQLTDRHVSFAVGSSYHLIHLSDIGISTYLFIAITFPRQPMLENEWSEISFNDSCRPMIWHAQSYRLLISTILRECRPDAYVITLHSPGLPAFSARRKIHVRLKRMKILMDFARHAWPISLLPWVESAATHFWSRRMAHRI